MIRVIHYSLNCNSTSTMFFSKFVLIVLCFNCCFLIDFIKCSESGDDNESDGGGGSKEEREAKEMEAFMKLMIKSSQKNLKRLLETVDIGAISGPECNSSWHQFMTENQLTPERFSTIMEDYKSGNHEKIVKLVRPEQCLLSENGKFCQIDHITNITMKSKARVFDLTYALCYPRGCSNSELNNILTALTDTYKGSMIQVKLNVVKCITSMENVTKMEIDTAQKMVSKITGGVNQTLELSNFKLPGSFGVEPGSSLPSSFNIPFSGPSSLPNFPVNVPDDVPMFSFEDLGIPRLLPSIETSTPPPPPPSPLPPSHFAPSPVMSTSSTHENTRSEMVSSTLTTSSQISSTPSPLFKWTESKPDESPVLNPLRYPDIYYSDELSESYKSLPIMTTTPPSPLEIAHKFDKTRLLKMIPGLIIHDDDD